MKKRRAPVFAEAAAPLVPLLPEFLQAQNALGLAAETTAVFLALALFFKLLAPAFPKRLLSFAFVLTVGAVLYALAQFRNAPPTAALSLCLLWFPLSGPPKKTPAFEILMWKALSFFWLAVFLGLAQDFLGGMAHLPLFQRVPGTFFLLVLPALVWPASRKARGELRS